MGEAHSEKAQGEDDESCFAPGEAEQPDDPHPNWRFARYLAAYRRNLTRSEASRRSGIPESLWQQVEGTEASDPVSDLVPAAIVAAMCVTVGADVETGLQLAGHRPDLYRHLMARPPVYTPLTQSPDSFTGPYIATPHILTEVLEIDAEDVHRRIAAVYRQLAQSNWQMASRIVESHPDERREYWTGYAAAVRAIAEQQAWSADLEEGHTNDRLETLPVSPAAVESE